jgi:hypothetical protein
MGEAIVRRLRRAQTSEPVGPEPDTVGTATQARDESHIAAFKTDKNDKAL